MKIYVLAQELSYDNDVKVFELNLSEDDVLYVDNFDDFNDYQSACISAVAYSINGNIVVMSEEQFKNFGNIEVKQYVPTRYDIELAS
jgi:hypothetical protein